MSKPAKKGKAETQQLINEAIPALRLEDISVIRSSSEVLNGFEPRIDVRSQNLWFQLRQKVLSYEVLELEDAETKEKGPLLLKVILDFGIRIGEKEELEQNAEAPEILGIIEAAMAVYYAITDIKIIDNKAALSAFSKHNSLLHVWPFWREHVSSQMTRMNFPKLLVPLRAP